MPRRVVPVCAQPWLPRSLAKAKAEKAGRTLGNFYRFSLNLLYKDEPVHIEFVGGCRVHRTKSGFNGGGTVETLAMSAFVFGARMPEGHAVVVRSNSVIQDFDVCEGATTSSGQVPADWLPLVTWYERDDDFNFGLGYATQDAYRSPRARFGFVNATVEHATAQDYERFVQNGPANLIPDYLSDAVSHLGAPYLPSVPDKIPDEYVRDPRKAWRLVQAPFCRGALVAELDPTQQGVLASFWPTNRPRYWGPSRQDSATVVNRLRLRSGQDGLVVERFRKPDTAPRETVRNAIYPISITEGLSEASAATGSAGWYDHVLHTDDELWKGFVFCETQATTALLEALRGGPVPHFGSHFRCKVGDEVLPTYPVSCENGWSLYIDDRYHLNIFHFVD